MILTRRFTVKIKNNSQLTQSITDRGEIRRLEEAGFVSNIEMPVYGVTEQMSTTKFLLVNNNGDMRWVDTQYLLLCRDLDAGQESVTPQHEQRTIDPDVIAQVYGPIPEETMNPELKNMMKSGKKLKQKNSTTDPDTSENP